MERILKALTIQPPPPCLRETVLAAARAELEQAASKPDWVDRVWGSRALWYSAAAIVLACLAGIGLVSSGGETVQRTAMRPPAASAAAADLAKVLAVKLGDGPRLEERLTAMLAGPAVDKHDALAETEIWRSIR